VQSSALFYVLGIVLDTVFVRYCLFPSRFRGGGKEKEEKFSLSSLVFALSFVIGFTAHSNRTAVDDTTSLSA